MPRLSGNAALKYREENLPPGKETLPPKPSKPGRPLAAVKAGKKILTGTKLSLIPQKELQLLAVDCLWSLLVRQKEIASFVDVSEGMISRWIEGSSKMSPKKALKIVEFYFNKRRASNSAAEERLEQFFGKMAELVYGPYNTGDGY